MISERTVWRLLGAVGTFALHMAGVIQAVATVLLSPFAPIIDVLIATSGQWYTVITITAGPLASEFALIPTDAAAGILVAAAVVFVSIKANQLIDTLQRRSNSK